MKTFKKSLGQNFLVDQNIKNKIIKFINIKKNDIIIEIGAGEGSISKEISNLSKKSYFIEIDKCFIQELSNVINNKKSTIHNDNILKFNIKDIIKKHKKIRIIGNLPYNISTKIIMFLTNFLKNIKDLHFLVQKEIAEKILKNKCKNNKISIKLEYFFKTEKIYDIKPHSFNPKPKIMSSFIKLTPKKNKNEINDIKLFDELLNKIFNNKGKKTKNLFKNINDKLIKNENITSKNISLKDILEIYKEIKNEKEECK